MLAPKPTDPTNLTRRYGGAFPGEYLVEVIDGREMINPHRNRDMPVWGNRFQARAEEAWLASVRDLDPDALAWNRIGSLVAYLEGIQVE